MKDFDVPLDAQRYTALGKHLKKFDTSKKLRNQSDNREYSEYF